MNIEKSLLRQKTLLRQRTSMKRLRAEGNDQWRNTKRTKYNKTKYAQSAVDNRNRKQLWVIGDINKILDHNKPDLELSIELGRSVEAIQVKRSKCSLSDTII